LEESRPFSKDEGPRAEVRVLFADDDAAYRLLLRAAFSTFDGVDVIGEATNGQQAVELVSRAVPDVVLLDVEMPVMDGFAAALAIRRICPDARVVLHTGDLGDERRARAAELDLVLFDKLDIHDTIDLLAGLRRRDGIRPASS
jgi:DNA-binding NarL/FixJ family response regulator